VTFERGPNERCDVVLNKDRRREGAHHSSKKRKNTRGEKKKIRTKKKKKMRQMKACMCVGECLRVHVRLGARAGTQGKNLKVENGGVPELRSRFRRHFTGDMNFAISRRVSEFTSDTIQARNEKSALASKT
jgi:hypothetical protein